MKKIVYAIFALCMLASVNSKAQSNVFKINIFSPVVKTASVFYERALNEQSSVQLGFFYTGYSGDDTKFRGIGITPEYRFYLSETAAPNGFYVGPFIRYQNFDLTDEISSDEATYSAFGGGLLIGRQWIFKERVALDAFIGPSYVNGDVKVSEGSEGSFDVGAVDGFGVRLGVTLGIGF